jgi:segregation and condensation protein A
MSYKVKLDVFEGPFDLLVYLIEHARMSVYDIQISEITTQYLQHIEAMKRNDIAVTQDFMVLAAELIEIKSRMLLPQPETADDGSEPEDPRSSLVQRILEYKQFKGAAQFLADQEEEMSHVHTKPQEDLSVYEDEPDEVLRSSQEQFAAAFRAFLFRRQKLDEMKRTYERIERQRMSLENRITQIRDLLVKKGRMMFSGMLGKDKSSYNRVITFMALLEMMKTRSVKAEQKKLFGDISVSLEAEK